MQEFDAQSRRDECADDIGERVLPLIRDRMLQNIGVTGVGAVAFDPERLRPVEVAEFVVEFRRVVAQSSRERMVVGEVEHSAPLEELCRDRGPSGDVGDPAQHPICRVDDVEGLVENAGQVVDVGTQESCGEIQPAGQRSREVDGIVGDIDAGHRGAQPCPAEGVLAEVALQVQQALSGYRPDFRLLDTSDTACTTEESLEIVELRPGMQPGTVIPVLPIRLDEPVHARVGLRDHVAIVDPATDTHHCISARVRCAASVNGGGEQEPPLSAGWSAPAAVSFRTHPSSGSPTAGAEGPRPNTPAVAGVAARRGRRLCAPSPRPSWPDYGTAESGSSRAPFEDRR